MVSRSVKLEKFPHASFSTVGTGVGFSLHTVSHAICTNCLQHGNTCAGERTVVKVLVVIILNLLSGA